MATTLPYPQTYLTTEDRDNQNPNEPPPAPPVVDVLTGTVKRGGDERPRGASRLQYTPPAGATPTLPATIEAPKGQEHGSQNVPPEIDRKTRSTKTRGFRLSYP